MRICSRIVSNMLPQARPCPIMKLSLAIATASISLSLLTAGCSSTSTKSAATNAAAQNKGAQAKLAEQQKPAPTPASAPVVEAPRPAPAEPTPAPEPPAPIKVAPEALALVERLTHTLGPDTLRHELTDTTGFPEAMRSLETGAQAPNIESVDTSNQPPPEGLTADGSSTQLIVRDWTGLVLVPISTSLSKAYTSEVRLLRIEAHPLNDGRVRVWTRIHNISERTLPGQVACRGGHLPSAREVGLRRHRRRPCCR